MNNIEDIKEEFYTGWSSRTNITYIEIVNFFESKLNQTAEEAVKKYKDFIILELGYHTHLENPEHEPLLGTYVSTREELDEVTDIYLNNRLTMKRSTMSDKENTRSDNEETEQVNNELSTSEDLTCDRHGESDYPMNNGLYFLTDEDKANIERNALIEFSNWCFANDYKSALNKITNYLEERAKDNE